MIKKTLLLGTMLFFLTLNISFSVRIHCFGGEVGNGGSSMISTQSIESIDI